MDQTNPYQAPASHPSPVASSSSEVSPDVIRILAGTKGWARFLAVIGFIVTVFMVIAAIAILGASNQFAFLLPGLAGMIAFVYLVMAILNFVAAFKLNQYASRIGYLISQPSQLNLVSALDAQRGFWKYVGIVVAVVLSLYILLFIIGAAS